MRIFVVGATRAIGAHLVPQFISAGHQVAGMTRRQSKAARLRQLGVEAILCDVFDAEALSEAITAFAPDAVIHQLTDLPADPGQIPAKAAAKSRVRREGTSNLIAAAQAAGTPRFLAQSVAFELAGHGAVAVRDHERAVLDIGGVVLRLGAVSRQAPGRLVESSNRVDEVMSLVDNAGGTTLEAAHQAQWGATSATLPTQMANSGRSSAFPAPARTPEPSPTFCARAQRARQRQRHHEHPRRA